MVRTELDPVSVLYAENIHLRGQNEQLRRAVEDMNYILEQAVNILGLNESTTEN